MIGGWAVNEMSNSLKKEGRYAVYDKTKPFGNLGTNNEPTVTLNGDEIARIIEMAYDYGWEAGRDSDGNPFDGGLSNCKYQINNWLEENGEFNEPSN